MSRSRTIEVDEETADTLEARAAARGTSVSELVADLLAREQAPIGVSAEEIAELDRQWEAIERGQATIPHEQVARWLDTWGTPASKRQRQR